MYIPLLSFPILAQYGFPGLSFMQYSIPLRLARIICFFLPFVPGILSPNALAQRIGLEVKSTTLITIEESRDRYDLMNPTQVVGKLTYDGIILPIVLMDREGDWHQVSYSMGMMRELADARLNHYAHIHNQNPFLVYRGREVFFSFETSEFSGFLAECPEEDTEGPCLLQEGKGGIVLTWKDAPAFFENAITVEADSFEYHAPILETFLAAETEHIEESPHHELNGRFYTRKGGMGIPVNKTQRDSSIIQITYTRSGALKDSLHLFYIETRREFLNPCRKSTQSGLLLVEGDQINYTPHYYYAGECWSKESAGSSYPLAAFTFKDRLYIMEEHYGYEGKSYTVSEVIAGDKEEY